ncbi:hypothetical protein SS1G_11278 [Sclerotinia sclerotiorum 1980 UF-70]|uniref:MARVEL domain-containing protein n=2 Tax=Sclerotinia sclerotiorum (strain ATCC 18683 / 1980 / Ss-1) TaxID=665079 RepID=A0A1D9QH39_SCLS1|nr:hypothetical protein SS1G_11278 [Sclerotinia sclerotiorum 1980 UF-70]APA13933.1 hypothetical protein sscle_12g087030 [Sclerotinia sclerotiorum 1980 UF-70]EDN95401.1 hypothetical protein SS1G_11278 [Sclerotinia sclerotiorum 1980 UF-70]
MVSTLSSSSVGFRERSVLLDRTPTKYRWPPGQLNFWIFFMLIASSTILGISAYFLSVQNQLHLGVPWYFPYWIVSASLGILFIILMLWLISQRQLLPGIVILGTFILFVLWLVGLIVWSIELWGPSGSVNGNCNLYVTANPQTGASTATLAWLLQHSICQSWIAAWAFMLIGVIFLFWMLIMSYQVYRMDN